MYFQFKLVSNEKFVEKFEISVSNLHFHALFDFQFQISLPVSSLKIDPKAAAAAAYPR